MEQAAILPLVPRVLRGGTWIISAMATTRLTIQATWTGTVWPVSTISTIRVARISIETGFYLWNLVSRGEHVAIEIMWVLSIRNTFLLDLFVD